MAKKLQFKAPHGRLVHATIGGVDGITNDNLTEEIYNKLVAEAEGHKDLFEWVEEPEAKSKSSKPVKNDNVQA